VAFPNHAIGFEDDLLEDGDFSTSGFVLLPILRM
jgi:hypothetical protein